MKFLLYNLSYIILYQTTDLIRTCEIVQVFVYMQIIYFRD